MRDLAIDIAQNPDGTDEGPPGPLFTTDGSSFAVLTDAGRGVERVDLPDLTRTELHTVSQDHRILRPSPSPDGRMMLVQVLAVTEPFSEDQPPPRVMLLDTRTGEAVRVRELDRGWWWFTWSPDGTLAYARRSDRTAGGIWDRTRAVFDPWEDPPEDVLGWVRA